MSAMVPVGASSVVSWWLLFRDRGQRPGKPTLSTILLSPKVEMTPGALAIKLSALPEIVDCASRTAEPAPCDSTPVWLLAATERASVTKTWA